jgi:hypothetical protein
MQSVTNTHQSTILNAIHVFQNITTVWPKEIQNAAVGNFHAEIHFKCITDSNTKQDIQKNNIWATWNRQILIM